MKPLPRSFYSRDTQTVARELLGKLLVHRLESEVRIGRITEVEAYVGAHDLASHSSRGITPRTEVMYGEPGHAYVYLIYGMHHCMNIVTEPAGHGSAVLLRALEPVAHVSGNTRGPGLLCKALGIDLRCNRLDLCDGPLYVAEDDYRIPGIVTTARVGVDYAGDWASAPLRFLVEGSPWVSGKVRKAGSAAQKSLKKA